MDSADVVAGLSPAPISKDRYNRSFATATAAAIANADSITARFAEVVADNPNVLAVEDRGHRWTYAELAARAAGIARRVRDAGVHQHEPVALLYPHGAGMISAIFGVLSADKFYVPLIADQPLSHLQAIVRECGCHMLLVPRELADIGAQLGAPVLVVDDAPPQAQDQTLEPDERSGDAITYLLFTSGTTGVPKGVMQCDRNVLHHAACYASSIGLEVGDRMTLLPYYGFDASVMDIFTTLLTGASVHMWDVRQRGVSGIDKWLESESVTIWHSTPSVLRAAFSTFTRPAKLRWAVLGGEAAVGGDVALVARYGGPGCGLINGLGPTECTTALQYVADLVADMAAERLPVGRPVPGVEAVLLDERGQPDAMEGELAILSPFVALGYWNRPELTAERFSDVLDESSKSRGSSVRRYCTGDVLRLNADGFYEHLSRVDDQIKIRGMRVELTAVQAAITAHPNVLQAVVVPRTDERTQQTVVVAYVVPRESGARLAELRAHLVARLPDYMVPAALVLLARLPLLPNGKLDRRALPAPPRADRDRARKAPSTPLHRLLAESWAEVLQRDAVGIDENFFELGGDSLLGTLLLARIRSDLKIDAQLGDLFRHPTVEALASHLLESQ